MKAVNVDIVVLHNVGENDESEGYINKCNMLITMHYCTYCMCIIITKQVIAE